MGTYITFVWVSTCKNPKHSILKPPPPPQVRCDPLQTYLSGKKGATWAVLCSEEQIRAGEHCGIVSGAGPASVDISKAVMDT